MTPVDQQQVDRILAVVDALKSTAKSLERLHEVEAGSYGRKLVTA